MTARYVMVPLSPGGYTISKTPNHFSELVQPKLLQG
jgi:hypothetical protein